MPLTGAIGGVGFAGLGKVGDCLVVWGGAMLEKYMGQLVMDSVPPATTVSAWPVIMLCAPSVTALRPEAHTLLTVEHTTDTGRPAPRAHCLAGFCPRLLGV